MLFCGLCSHRDLHKNKGHKSVLVRKMHPSLPPSVMVAFGKTVIFHHHEQGCPYLVHWVQTCVDQRHSASVIRSWIDSMPLF